MPPAASPGICMTKVKLPEALSGRVAIVQVIVPPEPTAGAELQLKVGPEFWVSDWKVIPGGIASTRETPVALSGPAFKIVTSKETLLPAAALAGPVLVTNRSA